MKKLLAALLLLITYSSSTLAADNKKVAQCMIAAMVMDNDPAARRALQLADNPRIAKAEAQNLMDFIKRSQPSERKMILNSYVWSCSSIGVRLSK